MNARRLLVAAAMVGAVALLTIPAVRAAEPANTPERPNIVLIMADDVGHESFGCYGSKQYKTPNIDRMAQRGMRFTHCYSQPLCTPSRVMLMTGLSNARNYSAFSVLNRDQRTFGHHLQAAGYKTFVGGKWQLLGAAQYPPRFRGKGTWPREAGFDECCLWQVDKLGSRYWKPLLYIHGENRQFGKDDYGPDIVVEHIDAFMTANVERPFFVYYPMILTHDPFTPTPHSTSRTSKDAQRNFEDMVAYADTLVGRIVKRTEELGIADRTLILFTTDNGAYPTIRSELNGRTIQGAKGATTDAGTHAALVAYQPGAVPAGKVSENLVDFSDFLPTLLDAVGAKTPEGLDGRSFYPQLRGEAGAPREWIYSYYCPRPERSKPVRLVRDQRFKLYGDGRLFDVVNDPLEKSPIEDDAKIAGAAEARKKLSEALASMPKEGQTLLKFAEGKKD